MTETPRLSLDSAPAKVAAVTLGFWIAKVAATTLGESGGDRVAMSLNRRHGPRWAGRLELSRLYASLALLVFMLSCAVLVPQRAARSEDAA